jgi:hypothetical protein
MVIRDEIMEQWNIRPRFLSFIFLCSVIFMYIHYVSFFENLIKKISRSLAPPVLIKKHAQQ